MSLSEHLATDRALFVLALADDDPERVAVLAHAEHCPECRALISESRALLGLLDSARDDLYEPLDAAFETRVHSAVYGPKPTSRWQRIGLYVGALLSGLLAVFDAHPHAPELPLSRGVHCFLYEQAFALTAFALGALGAKWYAKQASAAQGALLAMGGALVGQAVLLVRCESNGAVVHLLLSHVLGVAAATVLGALAGPRLVALTRPAS